MARDMPKDKRMRFFPREAIEKLTGTLLAAQHVLEFTLWGKHYRTAHVDSAGRAT